VTSEAPRDPLIGTTIRGRYRVISTVGEGGMGTVYLAEQLSIGREVALKVLRAEFARDDVFVKRFHQEARLTASLNHPCITTIFDFDQGDDGSLFLVMEYLQGRTLSEIVRRDGALDVRRALQVAIQIAEGLGAAHRAGVIHRDVKPQNVMILEPGDAVKVMDFGIARLRGSDDTQLTRLGTMMGTPNYMAPEQIEGGTVSERTDIYAFGAMLHEMLAGRVPFSAPTATAVLIKHLQEAPTPIRSLRREVPPLVEQVLLRALEKDPARRQASMEEVAVSLRRAAGLLGEDAVLDATIAFPADATVARPVVVSPRPASSPPPELAPAKVLSAATARSPATGAASNTRWGRYLGLGAVLLVLVTSGIWIARSVLTDHSRVSPPSASKPIAAGRASEPIVVAPPTVPPPPEPIPRPSTKPLEPVTSSRAPGKPGRPTTSRTADVTVRPEKPLTPERPLTPEKPPTPEVPLTAKKQTMPDPGERVQDPRAIRALVEQKLRSAGLLKDTGSQGLGATVDIASDGVVTITGVLRDEEQLRETIRLAREVHGVSDVKPRINLRKSWGSPQ